MIESAVTTLELMALAAWIGAAWFRLWVIPTRLPAPERRRIDASMARLVGTCLPVLCATSVLLLASRAAAMMGEPLMQSLAMAPQVILHTHYGPVWSMRPVALAVLAVAWIAARRGGSSRTPWLAMLAAGALFAVSRSASGHAADAGDFTLQEAADWLHLVSISTWVGGVFLALWTVFPVLPQWVVTEPWCATEFAHRFSDTSAIALGAVLVSGLYGTFMRLPDVASLAGTEYGVLLSVKLALVAATIFVGGVNRRVYVKRMAESPAAGTDAHADKAGTGGADPAAVPGGWRSSTYFTRNVAVEAGLMLATLIVVSSLLQAMPPMSMPAAHNGATAPAHHH